MRLTPAGKSNICCSNEANEPPNNRETNTPATKPPNEPNWRNTPLMSPYKAPIRTISTMIKSI